MPAKALIKKANELAGLTRAKDWRLSFIPHIFGNLYLWIILLDISYSLQGWILLLLSLLTSFGFAALGYFINEFFDRDHDLKAGKPNKLAGVNAVRKLLLLAALIALTFIPWFYLPATIVSICLICIQLLLFLAYAAPPLRLKKKAWAAVFTDALYAYVVPLVLSYYTYYLASGQRYFHPGFLSAYSILLFTGGCRNIIIHYISDMKEDQRSGLLTLPNRLGAARTRLLISLLISAEWLLACLTVFVLASYQMLFSLLFLPLLFLIIRSFSLRGKEKSELFGISKADHLPDLFYQLYAPLLILLLLIVRDNRWLVLLPFHLLLFIPFFRFHPIISWWGRINFRLYYIRLRYVLSWIVNYSLFFFFLLFGVNLKKRNTSAVSYFRCRFSGRKHHKQI